MMTLVLIVVAALSQAGFARRSLALALEAKDAQEELQRRWATISCRRWLLDGAAERFQALQEFHADNEAVGWPSPYRLEVTLTVGRHALRCTVADENAKLNLNEFYSKKRTQLGPLLMETADGRLMTQLQPDLSEVAKRTKRWFTTWGQVFDVPQAFKNEDAQALAAGSGELTCWGDGQVNVFRAPDRVLERIATLAVDRSAARKLLAARSDNDSEFVWPDVLRALDLRRSEQLRLRRAFSDESSCYSLWMEVQGELRSWNYLWITGDGLDSGGDRLTFHW